MDVPPTQESAQKAAGLCETDCTPSSLGLLIRGPRQRQHRSRLHQPTWSPELHDISVYVQMEKIKEQSQDKKSLPKGDKEGIRYSPFPKQHTFFLARDPLASLYHR